MNKYEFHALKVLTVPLVILYGLLRATYWLILAMFNALVWMFIALKHFMWVSIPAAFLAGWMIFTDPYNSKESHGKSQDPGQGS